MLKCDKKYVILRVEEGVKMEQKQTKDVLILFLVVIVTILAALCVLFATGIIKLKNDSINDNTNIGNKDSIYNYDYGNLKGLYSFRKVLGYDENGKYDIIVNYDLYLYGNGTFIYRNDMSLSPSAFLGNYVIENDQILLNYMFRAGSGVGMTYVSDNKVIKINSLTSLTDNKQPIESDLIKDKIVTLEKKSSEEEKTFLENNDFSKKVDNMIRYCNR